MSRETTRADRAGLASATTATLSDVDEETPPPPPRRPIRPGRRRQLLAQWGFPAALAVLAGLTLVFALVGRDAILDSTEGDVVEVVTDPDAPGFRVLVEPTASALWALVDDGELVGVVVAGLGDPDGGGGLGVVPANLAPDPEAATTLSQVYATDGLTGLRDVLAGLLDIGFGDVAEIEARGWETLTAPVAPITVALATDLIDEDGEVVTPAGPVEIDAGDFGSILAWESPGAELQARVVRQGTMLSAYLDALAAAGADVVPGEGVVGVPLFLRSFASGSHFVIVPDTDEVDGVLVADRAELTDLAIDLVPFPLPAEPGARPAIRILDGVGDQAATLAVADRLVRAGAQVSVLGNADVFDAASTRIAYHTDAAREVAQGFRAALGVGDVVFEPLSADSETSFVAVTVTVGPDAGGVS